MSASSRSRTTREVNPIQGNYLPLVASKGDQGEARVTVETLLQASMRLRPDRIFLGEIRGAEAYSFLCSPSIPATLACITTVHRRQPCRCFRAAGADGDAGWSWAAARGDHRLHQIGAAYRVQQRKIGGWRGDPRHLFFQDGGVAGGADSEEGQPWLASSPIGYSSPFSLSSSPGSCGGMAYEIVVAWRWAPMRFPSEGANRWALFRMQNADRSLGSLLPDRLGAFLCPIALNPGTRAEALSSGLELPSVAFVALGLAGWLFAFINRRQMPFGGSPLPAHCWRRQARPDRETGHCASARWAGVTIRSDEPAHIPLSSDARDRGRVPDSCCRTATSGKARRSSSIQSVRISRPWPITPQGNGQQSFMFSPGSNDTHRYNPTRLRAA